MTKCLSTNECLKFISENCLRTSQRASQANPKLGLGVRARGHMKLEAALAGLPTSVREDSPLPVRAWFRTSELEVQLLGLANRCGDTLGSRSVAWAFDERALGHSTPNLRDTTTGTASVMMRDLRISWRASEMLIVSCMPKRRPSSRLIASGRTHRERYASKSHSSMSCFLPRTILSTGVAIFASSRMARALIESNSHRAAKFRIDVHSSTVVAVYVP